MKFKKPNTKTATSALALGGGAVVGGSLSKGVNSYLPEGKSAKMASKVAIAAAAFIAVSAISTNDVGSQALKGGLLGIGAEKAIGAIQDFAKTTDLATEDSTDKPMVKFAQEALGLKGDCGCTTAPAQRIASLNYAVRPIRARQTINMVETASNSFSAASLL